MKDEIKRMLTNVFWALNLPFFIVRVLVTCVPMLILTRFFYTRYEDNYEKSIRLACCMVEALWISGPIGIIHNTMRWTWFGFSVQDNIDSLFDRAIKKTF